jgi:CubicO group peptidase (beta-lactamase class C family)
MTTTSTSPTVHGSTADGFGPLRDVLASSLGSGDDVGAAVAVVHDGAVVADLWGGVADAATGVPWQRDTVVNVFSVTKPVSALAILLLADRGELDLDAPIARYWPEFAAAGKEGVLVRHALGHTSGVCGWQQPMTLADLYDLERSTAMLAEQEPWWAPGDGSGYQAMNFGHLLSPVVHAVTGQTLGEFVRAELAEPLGVDFTIGTPAELDARVATVLPPQRPPGIDYSKIPADSVIRKTLLNPVLDPREVNTPQWRRAELGAVNGHGNARAVATIQSVLSHGSSPDGRVTLSTSTVHRAFEVQSDAVDRVLYARARWGMGYMLGWPAGTDRAGLPEDSGVCWWVGWGGSFVLNDVTRRLTVAYATNRMASELIHTRRGMSYVVAAYRALTS